MTSSSGSRAPGGWHAALIPLLRSRLRRYRGVIAAIGVLQLGQALGMLYLPTLNAQIIDRGILARDTGYIFGRGGLMLAVTMVQVACAAGTVYLGTWVAMNVGSDLRAAVFRRVRDFSSRDISRFGTATLITRTTNDVQQVQLLVIIALVLALTAPFTGVGGLVLALRQDVPLSIVPVAAIPALVAVISLVIRAMIPSAQAMQGRIDVLNRVMREQIVGVRVIRAFVRDRHEQARFAAASTSLMAAAVSVGRLQAFFGASAMLVANLASVAVITLGGDRLAGGDLRPGVLVAFLGYSGQGLAGVMMALSVFMQAPRAQVSACRIAEVLAAGPGSARPTRPAADPGRREAGGSLEIRGVTFGYPGAEAPVLRDVSLAVSPGWTTAIVGSTGSGKTTLINLIARLADADAGSVTIDGVDVREMDRRALSAIVGLVPQRAYLFSGTIASNLRHGAPSADDAELWSALEIAQASDFVAALPRGLDTIIGQGGTTVSGGQRQRLAIARAIVVRPRIYLFDDAFSALDNVTDAALRAALDSQLGKATRIIVSQQVSTICSADRIAVLDAGRVEAVGTHEELLAESSVYAEIVASQRQDAA